MFTRVARIVAPNSTREGDLLALSRAWASMAVKGAGRSEVSHVGDVSSACTVAPLHFRLFRCLPHSRADFVVDKARFLVLLLLLLVMSSLAV